MDLNVGYYHICISEESRNLCTIILPWVKYLYKLLPMEVNNSPDIFQEKTNKMFRGFEFFQAYIYNLLKITKGDFSDHLGELKLTLQNLKDNDLKCNIESSFFGQTEMEYLGFWVTCN